MNESSDLTFIFWVRPSLTDHRGQLVASESNPSAAAASALLSVMANLSKRIAEYIKARPSLLNFVKPMATSYMSLKGHRRIGLRYPIHPSPKSSPPRPIVFPTIERCDLHDDTDLVRVDTMIYLRRRVK